MGTRTTTVTRNIDAVSWGAEAGLAYKLAGSWTADTSLSYVRGVNVSDDLLLAELPPLEARLGVTYDDRTRVLGALLRLVSAQGRIAIDQGNIVGQNIWTPCGVRGAFAQPDGVRARACFSRQAWTTYSTRPTRNISAAPAR